TEGLTLGVDDVPVALAVGGCRYVGLHQRKAAGSSQRLRDDSRRTAQGRTRPTEDVYCRANNCRVPAAQATGSGGTAGVVAGSRGESTEAEKVVAHLFQREPDS